MESYEKIRKLNAYLRETKDLFFPTEPPPELLEDTRGIWELWAEVSERSHRGFASWSEARDTWEPYKKLVAGAVPEIISKIQQEVLVLIDSISSQSDVC